MYSASLLQNFLGIYRNSPSYSNKGLCYPLLKLAYVYIVCLMYIKESHGLLSEGSIEFVAWEFNFLANYLYFV